MQILDSIIKIEEKNFFFICCETTKHIVWFFFVLVKYLQLWLTVQCLRIKFTAFRDSTGKKKKKRKRKTGKAHPNHKVQ